MQEHGIEAAATNRLQRLQRVRGEKQAVRQIRVDGRQLRDIGIEPADPARVAQAKEKERATLEAYRHMMEALSSSDDGEDRKLVLGLVKSLRASMRMAPDERIQGIVDRTQPGRPDREEGRDLGRGSDFPERE